MDAVNDPTVREVVVMKSAQVGWTEIIGNVLGFYIDRDPSPILLIQPTLEMGEAWSKDRFAPMIRDTEVLQDKIRDARARDSGNTLLHKTFPGGHVTIAGANSPSGLASRPIRIVLCDEVDRYPPSAGTEGDPVNLARKRANTFWNRKILMGSTPTIDGASRIQSAYKQSDMRRFYVPCPHCQHSHLLEWKNVVFESDKPKDAVMVCPECGGVIQDRHKFQMITKGEWRAEQPFNGIAGFHINELYSPWRRFSDVAEDFLASKDHPEKLKTWVNTSLGVVWEDRTGGEKVSPESLQARKATWTRANVPDETIVLTMGVDTQDDRLEATLWAWFSEKRARAVSHHVLAGSPGESLVWQQLLDLITQVYTTDAGRFVNVAAACVDAGGHHAAQVLDFCEQHRFKKVWAIRGMAGPKPIWPKRYSKSQRHKGKQQWLIGVDTAKDWLRSALAVQDETLPNHVGFSGDGSLDERFFKQLTVETRIVKYDLAGRATRTWTSPPGSRKESWDCAVYALAALEGLREMWNLKLHGRAPHQRHSAAPQQPPTAVAPATVPHKPLPPKPRPVNSRLGNSSWSSRL